jgi:transcriptional regulator GlxA family with amidase domain
VQIALVVYTGVLAEECSAFRSVLERLPGAEMLRVGSSVDAVFGPGGTQSVDATFAQVHRPDVVIVPGGLGCERVASDLPLRRWLIEVAPHCRWMVGSSTGSIVLAAAGLLDGAPAATHWLAGSQLGRYGVAVSDDRLAITTNRVTCEGRISAVAAAYTIVELCAGVEAADTIREQLTRGPEPVACRSPRRSRRARRALTPRAPLPGHTAPTAAPVEVDLVEVTGADAARRRRRSRGR